VGCVVRIDGAMGRGEGNIRRGALEVEMRSKEIYLLVTASVSTLVVQLPILPFASSVCLPRPSKKTTVSCTALIFEFPFEIVCPHDGVSCFSHAQHPPWHGISCCNFVPCVSWAWWASSSAILHAQPLSARQSHMDNNRKHKTHPLLPTGLGASSPSNIPPLPQAPSRA
jgi:hypothetical protein